MKTYKHWSVCVSLFPEWLPFALLWWIKQPPHLVRYFTVMTTCELNIYNLSNFEPLYHRKTRSTVRYMGKTLFNTDVTWRLDPCLISLVILLQFFFPYANLICLSCWKWYSICKKKKKKKKQSRNLFTTEMFYLVSINKSHYVQGNFECIISGMYTTKGSGYCGCTACKGLVDFIIPTDEKCK